MTEGWAGVLAAAELAAMPSNSSRDRVLVEALFVRGNRRPHLADMAVSSIERKRRWRLFEEAVVWASGEGLRLQSAYWTGLFEKEDPAPSSKHLADLGRSFLHLYDRDHLDALASEARCLLDPLVSGLKGIEECLEDPGLLRFLDVLSQRPPANARGT